MDRYLWRVLIVGGIDGEIDIELDTEMDRRN